jgi:GntR family transcriptional repressor for pyruvate dehydrogenase complex
MIIEEFHPIKARDKIEQIVEILKNLIIEEKLSPGSVLPSERELAAQLHVSRYSLRQALRAAQAQGLIELNQGKRPRVTLPSSDALTEVLGITIRRSKTPLSDLIIARISLECDIVSMVARKANGKLIERLELITKQMEGKKDNIEYCAGKDVEFHEALVEFSENIVFNIMLKSVAHLLRTSRLATLHLTGVDRALSGHKSIISALKQGDQEKARAAMLSHLEMAEDDIAKIENINSAPLQER